MAFSSVWVSSRSVSVMVVSGTRWVCCVVSRVPGVVVVVCLLFVLARWDKEGVVGESGEEEGVVGYVL